MRNTWLQKHPFINNLDHNMGIATQLYGVRHAWLCHEFYCSQESKRLSESPLIRNWVYEARLTLLRYESVNVFCVWLPSVGSAGNITRQSGYY